MKRTFITISLIILSAILGLSAGVKLERNKNQLNVSPVASIVDKDIESNKESSKDIVATEEVSKVKIDSKVALEKIKTTVDDKSNFSVDNLLKYENIYMKDKVSLEKLIKELPIAKISNIKDIETGINGGKKIINITLNFKENSNLDEEIYETICEKNALILQALIPDAELVNFDTNKLSYVISNEVLEEFMEAELLINS